MNQNINKITQSLTTLAPDSWFTQKEGSSFWLSVYRILSVPKESLLSESKKVDFTQVRAIILYGTLKYYDANQIEVVSENLLKIDASKSQMKETAEGVYLLLLTPFDVDGKNGNEFLTKQNISVAAALFAAFNGRNIIYEHLFDNIVHMDGRTSSFTPSIINPLFFSKPDISDSRLKKISESERSIYTFDEPIQERIRLSLRWFISALYDGGVDAYLKYWIAIETLAMPDTTNIGDIKKIISKAYSLSLNEVEEKFKIGRIFGLRGRIIHDGEIIPIHGHLLKYIEALYVDILFEQLSLPCENIAFNIINSNEFDFEEYLK